MGNNSMRQDPYQGLAPIYDYVMRYVDYGEWVDYVHSLLKRWDPAAAVVLVSAIVAARRGAGPINSWCGV